MGGGASPAASEMAILGIPPAGTAEPSSVSLSTGGSSTSIVVRSVKWELARGKRPYCG
eukprot:m.456180 g.456180  ORF g.456180 m.456180 type:complete len:58 (-) comp21005_c0_seq1:135-308(-)